MGPNEYVKEVMATMKKFRELNILCDTILVTDDQEIWAHSVVLAAVSPFLCSTFKSLGSTREARKIRYNVSLPGCSASDVELVLQFLYSGQLTMPSVYQQVDEFSRILFVCKSLRIDVGKLNGARVTFESSVERTAAASVDQWVEAFSIPVEAESSNCGGQLHKVEDIRSEYESGISSFPSGDNVLMSDLPSGSQNTGLNTKKMSSDMPMPLLSAMVPVISSKPSSNSAKGVVRNAPGQILTLSGSARLATRRNGTKEIPAKIFPSGDNVLMNDLPSGSQNTGLNTKKMSSDMPMPLLSAMVPVISSKPSSNSAKGVVRNAPGQILTLSGSARLATRRNGTKEIPAKIFPSADNVLMNDLPSGSKNTGLNTKKMSDMPMPLLSAMMPVISTKPSSTSAKGAVINTPGQILTLSGSARLATRRNGTKEIPAKIFPSADNVLMNDLPSGSKNTGLNTKKMSSDMPMPLLSAMVPVISSKPSSNSAKGAVINAPGQILTMRSSAWVATRRNGTKKGPAKITRRKQGLTEATLKAVRSGDEKDLLLTNNNANIPRSGNSDDHLDIKLSSSLVEMSKSDSGDILKYSVEVCEKTNAEKLTVGKDSEREQKLYSCLTCGKEFSIQRSYQKHVESLVSCGKSHVCDKCGKIVRSIVSLRVHQKIHIDVFPHVCEICGKGYKFKRKLRIHAMRHTGDKPILCDTCGRGFYYRGSLRRHVLMQHTTIRPYVCGICGKGFTTRQRLMRHKESHSEERPYSCETCGKSFKCAVNLSQHKMLHTSEKPYICPVCLRAFRVKRAMKNHMKTHAESADQRTSFVCQICGKSVSRQSSLKKHMQMHSQQKPHVCEVCGKCFAVKGYLSRHAVIHDELYVCEICRKVYPSERSLLEHSKTHTAIPCGKCGKEFAGPKALQNHMRVHWKEETFVCKVCGKGFELQSKFDAHSKLHLQ